MHFAEVIVERAGADDDFRLQLQGIDRVKSSLELVMRAVGMIGPDVQVNVDNRQVNQFAGWSTPAVRAITELAELLESGMPVQEALATLQAAKESAPALPPGREGEGEAA
jgi:hypothetical protein